MSNETGKQLIKSAAAVLCVASICVSAIISTNKISTMIKDTAGSVSVQSGNASYDGNNSVPSDGFINGDDTNTDISADDTGIVSDDSAASDNVSANTDTGSGQSTSAKASTAQNSSQNTASKEMSKAEIINYCNTALNKAKAAKVGYNKKMVREVKGSTDGISPSLIKLVAANKNTTMKKGSSDIKDDFPAAGYDWSSKLREKDVSNATLKKNGKYYEIKFTLGKEQNPAKGEASSYGRVMSVIDATEAGNMVPGIKSINMSYHDGYVYAKIDSTNGKLISAEFSAAADIQASIKIFGDVAVKDIVSTETFTNIVW